jgi:hypothetical protein
MKGIRYRLAKESDCKAIVDLHFQIRHTYDIGIFAKLGRKFLCAYYKIVLKDINSIIICAESQNGCLQGFCSASLDNHAYLKNLKRHRFKLALSALSSLILNPSLIHELFIRYRVIKGNSDLRIISTKGARSEFWVWRSTNKDSLSSIEMYFTLFNVMKSLGVKELFGEVDVLNKSILKFQLANGGEIVDRITLTDGRERVVIRINLETWKQRM